MRLWIKAVLLTLWHGIVAAALLVLCAVVATAAFFGIAWTVIELGDPAAVVIGFVTAVYFTWMFVSCVRDNHERLLHKAWLEKSARGGEKRCG